MFPPLPLEVFRRIEELKSSAEGIAPESQYFCRCRLHCPVLMRFNLRVFFRMHPFLRCNVQSHVSVLEQATSASRLTLLECRRNRSVEVQAGGTPRRTRAGVLLRVVSLSASDLLEARGFQVPFGTYRQRSQSCRQFVASLGDSSCTGFQIN